MITLWEIGKNGCGWKVTRNRELRACRELVVAAHAESLDDGSHELYGVCARHIRAGLAVPFYELEDIIRGACCKRCANMREQ